MRSSTGAGACGSLPLSPGSPLRECVQLPLCEALRGGHDADRGLRQRQRDARLSRAQSSVSKTLPPPPFSSLCRPLAHGTDDHRGRDCEGQDGQEEWGCMQLHVGSTLIRRRSRASRASGDRAAASFASQSSQSSSADSCGVPRQRRRLQPKRSREAA